MFTAEKKEEEDSNMAAAQIIYALKNKVLKHT
jgi:hypothetical protein